ncbi:MAG TPA: hypothetical protein VN887_08945, partial [Candidatus Angelobacter sp.]|nr:hypothetical protein [Candidatus Angelobacter sp.]
LSLGTNAWDPFFTHSTSIQVISNVLSCRESRLRLAAGCNTDESNFQLVRVDQPRNTSLISIRYSGTNSNVVQNIASNAAAAIVEYYSTNKPTWEVAYIDAESYTRRSLWRRILDEIEYIEFRLQR